MNFVEDYDTEEILTINNSSSPYCNQSNTNTNVPISIEFIPLGLGIIIITTLGIFANILSATVLTRKRLRSSYSVLTLGLTFADTLYLLTKLVRYGLDSLFSYFNIASSYTEVFLPIFGPYFRPLTFTANTASTYLTMAIALDRYIAISRPLKARTFCTTKQAGISTLIVVIFAVVYNIPRWWEFHTEECLQIDPQNSEENATIIKYSMKISELRLNEQYKVYYIAFAYTLVVFAIPFVTLSVLNYLIWKGVQNIQRSGIILTSTQSRDTSFALMLVGVVVVFLVCNLDYLVLDVLDYFEIGYPSFWSSFGNFCLTVNAAVNFIIYCFCGQKFRKELRRLFEQLFSGCKRRVTSHDIKTDWIDASETHTRQKNTIDMYHIRHKK